MTTPLVTEYGVHWNFFFSLVGVSLLKFFIRNVGGDSRSVIVLFVAYEAWVELCGGREWILGAKRDGGFVDQNREGVLGLGGYLLLSMGAEEVFGSLIWRGNKGFKVKQLQRSLLTSLAIALSIHLKFRLPVRFCDMNSLMLTPQLFRLAA